MVAFDVETVTVDSYTTLVDVDSQEAVLREYVDGIGDDAAAVSGLWRSQTIQYTMVANDVDAYRPFYDLLGLGLSYALESHGYDVPEAVRDEIRREVYVERLAVFEDVRSGIERIAEAGYPVYIVSNGDPEMLGHLVDAAGVEGVVEDAISADEVETYKPDAEIYRHAAARTGTPIGKVLHASGGTMRDVWGAKHAGMHAAWMNRPEKGAPRERLGADPDLVVSDFEDLADRLA
ncbi:MAG: haloacid dehalogenase type II [Haloplanus sp.]